MGLKSYLPIAAEAGESVECCIFKVHAPDYGRVGDSELVAQCHAFNGFFVRGHQKVVGHYLGAVAIERYADCIVVPWRSNDRPPENWIHIYDFGCAAYYVEPDTYIYRLKEVLYA